MAKRVLRVGHVGATSAAFVGKVRELTIDTTNKSIRVHDGVTAGGSEAATTDMANVAAATGGNAGKMSAAQATALSTATTDIATNASDLSTHEADTSNPHSVTKAQVGLTNVSDDAQLAIANDLSDVASAATSRSNLGLGTVATFAQGTGASEVPTNSQIASGVNYIPSGTILLFLQTSAPTGYTKLTDSAYNNVALRIITGTVTNGGADVFTTAFGSGKKTSGHALVEVELPVHNHSGSGLTADSAGAHVHADPYPIDNGAVNIPYVAIGSSAIAGTTPNTSSAGAHTHSISGSTGNSGNGNVHDHDLSLNIKYADAIVCQKD